MEHGLINTVIIGIVAAFIFALIAKKLKLPAIFGYLLAGIAIGPQTPGIVADLAAAQQLAEIGIILLMFGVGLHFSFKDLLSVRSIALPGAIVQMLSATLIGALVAYMLGHSITEGLVFGFSLSVASTIVLLRALEQRDVLDSNGGKIAIGWLIVEDLVIVLALVLLPAAAEMIQSKEPVNFYILILTILTVIAKISVFFVFMIFIGRRLGLCFHRLHRVWCFLRIRRVPRGHGARRK